MLIEEHHLRHWMDHFYGYGSWQAPFWFISHEEGGGELPEEVGEKLNYFYKAYGESTENVLCDIRELYSNVSVNWEGTKAGRYRNRFEYRFGPDATPNTIWQNLIAFKHAVRNQPLPDPVDYQRRSFATADEALIPLFPLPGPHSHGWYYSWLQLRSFPFLRNRESYERYFYEQRMAAILSKMSVNKPRVVLMYGMSNIQNLKKTIGDFFNGISFRMVRKIERSVPQYHRADVDGTMIIITTQIPALRHRRVETGFDWEAFGRSVGGETESYS